MFNHIMKYGTQKSFGFVMNVRSFCDKILVKHHKRLRKCHAKFVTDVL